MNELFEIISEKENLPEVIPGEVAPLMLAHVGDAIHEVVVRSIVLSKGNRQIEKVHKNTTRYVNAGAQAAMADILMDILTEEELDIYKRGRNAKAYTKAKNASIGDYRKATGFEALMGYLYLSGKTERMVDLLHIAIEKYDEMLKASGSKQ